MSTATLRRSQLNASVLKDQRQERKMFLIDGMSPENYAEQWGDMSENGAYFYNFCQESMHTTAWLRRFHNIIFKMQREIFEFPERYDYRDYDNLGALRAYVMKKIDGRLYKVA